MKLFQLLPEKIVHLTCNWPFRSVVNVSEQQKKCATLSSRAFSDKGTRLENGAFLHEDVQHLCREFTR